MITKKELINDIITWDIIVAFLFLINNRRNLENMPFGSVSIFTIIH